LKISIDVKGIDAVMRRMSAYKDQFPFAMSRALNNVAFSAMREGQAYLEKNIDRPTRFTVKSWYVRKKATKRDLVAVVGWSDYLSQKRVGEGGYYAGAEYYLSQHWNGGGRKLKAFEKQLIRRGIMPANTNAVPGKAAYDLGMIDRYGNMKGSVLVAILSAVGAFDEMGYTSNATVRQSKRMSAAKSAAKKVYWAGKPGPNTPNGIWMLDERYRRGRGRLRPVIVFVKPSAYKKRLNIEAVAKTVEQRDMVREFTMELDKAIKTAR
jgi:hypothetical protein